MKEKEVHIEYKNILIEKIDGVGVITITCPQIEDRLTIKFFRDVVPALRELDADEDVLVLMLKTAGPDFSAGNKDLEDREMNEWFVNLIGVWRSIRELVKPIIAVVQGRCLASVFVTA